MRSPPIRRTRRWSSRRVPSASKAAGGTAGTSAAIISSAVTRVARRCGFIAIGAGSGSCMAYSREAMSYAELHCVSNFSFLRGASHPEELVARAQELGYTALAITDECSLAGVVRAHVEAKNLRFPLIIGSEFRLDDGLRFVLLATDREGYGNLSALVTRGRRNAAKGSYRLTRSDLSDGVGNCLALWLPEHTPDAEAARWLAALFSAGRAALRIPGGDRARRRAANVLLKAAHRRRFPPPLPGGKRSARTTAKGPPPDRARARAHRRSALRSVLSHRLRRCRVRALEGHSLPGTRLSGEFGGVLLPRHHRGRSVAYGDAVRAFHLPRPQP